jgi:hypothetical protein
MATIAMALGKIGNVMAGLPGNDAADIVQHNVDTYYRQQKERVDNLFSVAKLSGESEDNLRQAYASRLATMQIQHGATNLALADRIAEIAAQNKGRVDVAKAAETAAQLRKDGTEGIENGRNALAELALKRSQAFKNYAEGAYAKERANQSLVTVNVGGAVAQLKKAIEEGSNGKPLTASEIQTKADELGIPSVAKPGQPSVENITKQVAFTGKQNQIGKGFEVRNSKGDIVGTADSAKIAKSQADSIIAGEQYINALKEYKDTLGKGRIASPYSEEAKLRNTKRSEVIARARTALGLGVSNAQLALDEKNIGGAGVGLDLHPMSSPEQIQHVIDRTQEMVGARINTLHPVSGGVPQGGAGAGGGALPHGVPAGSVPLKWPSGAPKTSGGKQVYQAPDGSHHVGD